MMLPRSFEPAVRQAAAQARQSRRQALEFAFRDDCGPRSYTAAAAATERRRLVKVATMIGAKLRQPRSSRSCNLAFIAVATIASSRSACAASFAASKEYRAGVSSPLIYCLRENRIIYLLCRPTSGSWSNQLGQ